jgi:hypothetical protein
LKTNRVGSRWRALPSRTRRFSGRIAHASPRDVTSSSSTAWKSMEPAFSPKLVRSRWIEPDEGAKEICLPVRSSTARAEGMQRSCAHRKKARDDSGGGSGGVVSILVRERQMSEFALARGDPWGSHTLTSTWTVRPSIPERAPVKAVASASRLANSLWDGAVDESSVSAKEDHHDTERSAFEGQSMSSSEHSAAPSLHAMRKNWKRGTTGIPWQVAWRVDGTCGSGGMDVDGR